MNALELPGVRWRPTSFFPTSSKHRDAHCFGVQAHLTDRNKVQTVTLGLHLIKALHDLFPNDFQFRASGPSGKSYFDLLLGTDKVRAAIEAGTSVPQIVYSWQEDLSEFTRKRQGHLLYI